MDTERLREILLEYRPSMRIVVAVDRAKMLETTVLELYLKLGEKPVFSILGYNSCIIREHLPTPDKPASDWLEIDVR